MTTTTISPTVLLDTLEDLAALIENAKPVFMSSDVRVDREGALSLVDELRQEMPTAVEHADESLRAAEQELIAARHQAEELIAQARAAAVELTEREHVVAAARTRAAEIIEAAHQEADRLTTQAHEYTDQHLAAFDETLDSVKAQVAAGRARLAEKLGPDAARPRWDSPADVAWPGE
jgi:cell division septum initiation protein DivIVA